MVGIGASAGGLEALEQLLGAVAPGIGLAFVVVQHLDPTHKGLLVELLQRACALPVSQITEGLRVEPDHVYVIPPDADLAIAGGQLHLTAPSQARGLRLPIDHFFASLAADRGELAVGVLLSGMGSDGTAGLGALRARGGCTFAQEPASAKFDPMPRGAIDAGVVDEVAPAAELPARIVGRLRLRLRESAPASAVTSAPLDSESRGALEQIAGLLRTATGNDFSLYKTSTLQRRIERRMGLHRIDKIAQYAQYLRDDPKEAELLFHELLVGVTSFFRDPAAWAHLESEVLPALITAAPRGARLRAWVPACSTGEEVYSLAICVAEVIERVRPAGDVQIEIFATDLDAAAVARARRGLYPATISADVAPARLARFFVEDGGGYRVRKEIRDRAVFAIQNVLQDPPFTRLDLLLCRNLLIYLTSELQRKLLPLFHYSLRTGGVLLLGSSETASAFPELFAPISAEARLYRRLDPLATSPVARDFPVAFARGAAQIAHAGEADPAPRASVPTLSSIVEQILLARFAPAALLASSHGDILYVSGHTGRYLELPAGKANWNVFAMARDGLRHSLMAGFQQAQRERRPVTLVNLTVTVDGHEHAVDVVLEPLLEPAALRSTVMIVFMDRVTPPVEPVAGKGLRRPERAEATTVIAAELAQVTRDLEAARRDAQASQEELRSANEEMQSTNEELQSTNKELTTSKEEMQSMNEELQSVNAELQSKLDELSRTANDMKNLLDSTEIAVLFLDEALNVRRFTPQAATLIKLIPGDVGRPLSDLVTQLDYPEISDDAREVLRTLVFRERAVASRDGRRFAVRIMPYRTNDNRIDGVVITFTNRDSAAEAAAPPGRTPGRRSR